MTVPTPHRRPYYPTPSWLVLGSLAVTGLLFLSERWRWFAFNEHKGWTVLMAVAGVGVVLLLMLLWWGIALIFRLRFQFSLRSLLVLVFAVALPFSWLGMEMKEARRQSEIVNSLTELGMSVTYDWKVGANGNLLLNARPPGPVWLQRLLGDGFFSNAVGIAAPIDWNIDFAFDPKYSPVPAFSEMLAYTDSPRITYDTLKSYDTKITDAALEKLKGLTALQVVLLDETEVTDAGLENLSGLTTLQVLKLDGTKVTDAGLDNIRGLTGLQGVSLAGTRITDAGLDKLERLTTLQSLCVGGTKVTDAGLKKLKRSISLRNLELNGTKVTDAGLENLRGLTALRLLYLNGTKVTDAGVKRLQKALPNCKIER